MKEFTAPNLPGYPLPFSICVQCGHYIDRLLDQVVCPGPTRVTSGQAYTRVAHNRSPEYHNIRSTDSRILSGQYDRL
ncbi:hypothetical protein RRG08_014513 [Elysia crispata]|uniref:Uncharacterized protein n=1 Tax=Elysia crispata TaxID=231223 RepID=A0AAE1E606_9GAST|nr:hypothetical protein RRG08_014513 [Elysia crispata]